MEILKNYFDYNVSLHTDTSQRIRFYLFAFMIISTGVLLTHSITAMPLSLIDLLVHSLGIGLVFTISLFLIELTLLLFWRKLSPFAGVPVKTIWLISLAMFLLGYLLIAPLKGLHNAELHPHWPMEQGIGPIFQTTPIWLVMTFMFIQSRLKQTLQAENQLLQKIAQGLERQLQRAQNQADSHTNAPEELTYTFNKGNLTYKINVNKIGLVKVEDHYCYLQVMEDDEYKSIDIQASLQDMRSALPGEMFVQVHRSYLVNLSHITQLKKVPRSYELIIGQSKFTIPVSRYRLSSILPRLSEHLML